ncbi:MULTISPECIES: GAF and ANTAR domain-containing protein [unclassified Rhodococcus (in: high G+C Gram-positive bacteria)]|uniref:GAF and ANTAR domain-containing protein n=1 Tax=unclassified Rhodococcus (in: high G+C Gram-positive bacteria) TaxID=192944 RepID=UPI001C9B9A82|nr:MULTISPECIES: GAF and ANTAR domain-containing protein [unclassified Rhodococcus (in: high G+C Gram-positive bacteria)]MBY6709108.1 GAF and ANTAR domain-containing protein [Rhodococcus sp. BP-241]
MDAHNAHRATKGSVRANDPPPVRWGHPEQDADVRSALGTSVDTDAGLDRALRSLVALSSKAIDGAASCGVTVQVADRVFTAVHSDARTLRVDADQYEIGSGPCLHAARTGDVVRVDRVEAEKRWPRFADVAREENIRSFLAVPLATERVRFGSLNLYGEASSAFTDADVDTAVGLTRVLAEVLGDYDRFGTLRAEVQGLRDALEHRGPIEQAKGILMAVHGVTADEAFRVPVERSQVVNRKVRVADDLIESVARPQNPPD